MGNSYFGMAQRTANEQRVLEHLRKSTTSTTADLVKELGLDDNSVNECLIVLESEKLLEFLDRVNLFGGKSEFITARITGDGIKAVQGRPLSTASLPQINVQQIGTSYGVVVQAPQGNVVVTLENAFKPFLDEISLRKDIDDYEKELLKRRIVDLQEALEKGDGARFQSVKGWLSKHYPWILSMFSNEAVIQLIKRALGT